MTIEVPLNDLSRLTSEHIDRLTSTVRDVIRSGHYIKGPHTQAFESRLSEMIDHSNVLALANGTDALILALECIGAPKKENWVAVAPNAGGYSSIAALRSGWNPICVDVDDFTGQMHADSLNEVLDTNPHVRAVIVTHLYGLVGDIEKISSVCRSRGVILIEDCAQSFGARVNGKASGSFGDIATFSFYPTKNLGAFGDAGAIGIRSSEIFERAQQISQYGWATRYHVATQRGFNSRIDEIQAALLNIQLETLQSDNAKRRQIIGRYASHLDSGRSMIYEDNERFVGHLAIMKSPSRDLDISRLKRNGINTGIHYPMLDVDQPAWQKMFIDNPPLHNAFKLNAQIITLPCFPTMTEEEVSAVEMCLKEIQDGTY